MVSVCFCAVMLLNPAKKVRTKKIIDCLDGLVMLIFNTILIKKPITGTPTSYSAYFAGSFNTHLTGVLGGLIWGLGNSLNLIAAGRAGSAISYGLGQGATLVAALWGVFIWKEFKNAPRGTNTLLGFMFLFFAIGIVLLIYAGDK